MKIAREAQIKQKEHFQAVQAERERQVFERILQSQIEEVSLSPKKDGSSDGTLIPRLIRIYRTSLFEIYPWFFSDMVI